MSKCLVTGGAGFIGSHVVDELLKHGHEVLIIDDLSGGLPSNFLKENPPMPQFIRHTIKDAEFLDSFFSVAKPDYVFHLAAYAAESLSHHIRRFNYETNLIGSINLINASIKYNVKCFVFTSSAAVFGDKLGLGPHGPIPMDPYGIAKLAVEQDLEAACQKFGLNYLIFRPHNVYGPRQNIADKYRNVIGIFMNQILNKKPLTVFGDGKQIRAFTYIDDLAPYIAEAPFLKHLESKIYNIGSDVEIEINVLVDLLSEITGNMLPVFHLDERHEARRVFIDHSDFKRDFTRYPETLINEGLARMWEHVKKQGPANTPMFQEIEIMKGLPEGWP